MNHSSDEKKVTPVSSPSKRRSIPWSGIGILFSTLSVILLLGMFYWVFHRLVVIDMTFSESLIRLENKSLQSQNAITSLQEQSQAMNDTLKNQSAMLTQLHQAESVDKTSWRVLSAQYYAKLAAANLQFENNVPLAIQLLQTADQELSDSNDPKVLSIRKALASDISALQSLPQVDYMGLYLRLSAMNNQIDQLPLIIKSAEDHVPPVNNQSVWWKRGWQETLRILDQIVIVRYNTSGVPPLVSPEQRDFLLQNLHAEVEKAMWAVLHKQASIYQESLLQAEGWIKRYFVLDSPVTQSVLKNMAELQKMNINSESPKTIDSLQAFYHYFA